MWCASFTVLCLWLAAPEVAARMESDGAVGRVAGFRDEPLTQYRAYRRMHARTERFNQEAWLEAWTEFDSRGFRYQIVKEDGSEYMRTKVLKAVLKREQEMVASGANLKAELTTDNYEFQESAPAGRGERYVLLKPKRKDVLLLDGRMVLSPDGRELLRVEGRMSKNPSFWTSLVNIIRHYTRLDGVRVPISTESVAQVKFAGLSYLDARYEYQTINGRPVSVGARAAR
jgi:hypothetical protein